MGGRMTNGEFGAIAVLIVLALVVVLPISGLIQLGNALGWPVVVGTGIVVVIAVTAIRSARARETAEQMQNVYDQYGISPERIAAIAAFALDQPEDITINEFTVGPANQPW